MQVGVFDTGNLNLICYLKRHGMTHRGYFKNCKANGIGNEEESNGVTSLGEWKKNFLNGKQLRRHSIKVSSRGSLFMKNSATH
jgi:hypothetical protein